MFRRSELVAADGRPVEATSTGGLPGRPDRAGALDALLAPRPLFRTALRGYDRLQVDDYVAWTESELLTTRRETDDLLSRYGACAAELEISRRLLACSPEGRDLVRTSERVGEILRLAADEAAVRTEAGTVQADRIRAEARSEADQLLRRAAGVKEAAVAECRLMEADARRARDEARARQREAEVAAERLLAEAAAERARLARESAERRAREEERARAEVAAAWAAEVAAAQAELDDLARRRDDARVALQRLTAHLDDALGRLTGSLVDDAHPQPVS
ncbi:hypothetical protein GCU56_12455 [Geodermatophilus sabuli]|uniref:DivIVA domain-containing protein n=1 Tax=Geodermatophilus sabuli TaxID=1564158 RepID=A0A7K3W204_9ACTN|nr:hypothetical protein [Geodermatophilus sabuli]NEK58680.1 hypothetical protein [Geodermatophilus sabuli]